MCNMKYSISQDSALDVWMTAKLTSCTLAEQSCPTHTARTDGSSSRPGASAGIGTVFQSGVSQHLLPRRRIVVASPDQLIVLQDVIIKVIGRLIAEDFCGTDFDMSDLDKKLAAVGCGKYGGG
ncbi:hypothetical protein J6590_000510 [Homalodisca vitripennis]|nr:hypothetical protein J6590_000510 [Homalodisca vitripennis]